MPIQLVEFSKNGGFTPARKPRMHTPVRPVVHAVIDDDDEPEVFNESLTFKINIEIAELAITTINVFVSMNELVHNFGLYYYDGF